MEEMGTLKRRWSNDEKTFLLYLLKRRATKYEMENELRRSEGAINARLYALYRTTNLTEIYEKDLVK